MFSAEEEEESFKEKIKKKLLEYLLKCIDLFCVWDCCWAWKKFAELVELLVFDPFVELFITLCIVVNTLFMAMDHYGMNCSFEYFLRMGNYVSRMGVCVLSLSIYPVPPSLSSPLLSYHQTMWVGWVSAAPPSPFPPIPPSPSPIFSFLPSPLSFPLLSSNYM